MKPDEILIETVELLKNIDISFYANSLDDLSLTDKGMQKYLGSISQIKDPYSNIHIFSLNGRRACYYKTPKSASTSILEAFMAILHPGLTSALSRILVNEKRNLYYSYLHQGSKRYLTKDPLNDILNADIRFAVHRPYADRLVSAITSKILVPYVNNDIIENYIVSALGCANSEEAIEKLSSMKLSDILQFALTLADPHFQDISLISGSNFVVYDTNNLSRLQQDISTLLSVPFQINQINSSNTSIQASTGAKDYSGRFAQNNELAMGSSLRSIRMSNLLELKSHLLHAAQSAVQK